MSSFFAFFSFSMLRLTSKTRPPWDNTSKAAAFPIPDDPPITITFRDAEVGEEASAKEYTKKRGRESSCSINGRVPMMVLTNIP
mmetsp:Transcript_23149/g.48212  ORF Transcript_23149/g.48212 Transcript_23149/m.48212 type:complete len:84 (-) Transcript_23149:42-293(-)